ncbi:hypothetical protein [Methylobacterium sp. E-045]|uniref:hypothetical protein n=1 Tax=Methylobacterium sp. E-045 TaxID=2836575 RepID=UPI001FB952B1|nr:hypothetical protein [Methylobacterium sp. E-045]MCJ2130865.1 hypothetical protein [Methylobacterium sp. E-045]
MRRSAAGLGALCAFALLSSAALAIGDGETPARVPGHAEKTFLIPAGEGYGVGECLAAGSGSCGQVVADAWCEAQGFAVAGSFGLAAPEDHTGAIAQPETRTPVEPPIRITCKD